MTHPRRSFCRNTTIVYIYNTVIYTNYNLSIITYSFHIILIQKSFLQYNKNLGQTFIINATADLHA